MYNRNINHKNYLAQMSAFFKKIQLLEKKVAIKLILKTNYKLQYIVFH